MLRYKPRFVIFKNPHDIFNFIGPGRLVHNLSIQDQKKEINHLITKRNEIDNFYTNLEDDVLKNGIRNPIIVNAGWVPIKIWEDKTFPEWYRKLGMKQAIICLQLGGSRLFLAQKHNLPIPAIVNDFVNRFPTHEEILTHEYILEPFKKLFKDEPRNMFIERDGIGMDPCFPQEKE